MVSQNLIFDLPFEVIRPTDTGKSDSKLLADLNAAAVSKERRGKARKNLYPLWTNPKINITGWSFQEFDYGKPNIPLASNARGLFTMPVAKSEGDAQNEERIVVRGYDKFFNINELAFLNWDWIEKNSDGHFEVTSKENGCIVFISGLEDGTLIVTSKKSTGPQENKPYEEIHSYVGQKWVLKHLESKNVDVKDFAKLLFQLNVTAVGELCDDAFEEHVLAYPPEMSGIYLHGLNLNTDKFITYPFSAVEAFAKMFGFVPTEYFVIDGVKELRTFLEACAETGTWKNKEVEGFVIRSKMKLDQDSTYSDYFFKYKFEEPYLMYRQWREVTKAYLAGKNRQDISIKKNFVYTNKYLDFAIPLLAQDEALREKYLHNHGIIEVRQKFLAHVGITGSQIIEREQELENEQAKTATPKYILVPVSTIGCGKTTVANALTNLFPAWGHVQNDDITRAPKPLNFAKRCMEHIRYINPLVIADRNNHQKRERQQLIKDMDGLTSYGTKNVYICLNFRPEFTKEKNTDVSSQIWNLTTRRVSKRGNNHQTIDADSMDRGKLMGIMKGFVSRFEPVDTNSEPDSEFDLVIDLDSTTTDSSRKNLELVVEQMHNKYPNLVPEIPSKQQLDEAFEKALQYKPTTTNGRSSGKETKKKAPRYYAARIDVGPNVDQLSESLSNVSLSNPPEKESANDSKASEKFSYANAAASSSSHFDSGFAQLIENMFIANPSADRSMWDKLKKTGRVQSEFHITLAHKSCLADPQKKALFQGYKCVYDAAQLQKENGEKKNEKDENIKPADRKKQASNVISDLTSLTTDVVLKHLCFDGQIMAVDVQLQNPNNSSGFDNVEIECCNKAPHITIGTINSSVPAVKAGQALEKNEPTLIKIPWNIEPKVLKKQFVAAYY